jgi:hypothetical protein
MRRLAHLRAMLWDGQLRSVVTQFWKLLSIDLIQVPGETASNRFVAITNVNYYS